MGMTSRTFKKRYANHKKSNSNPRYSCETELSKYMWDLKNKKRDFAIKWSIFKHVAPRAAGRRTCNLCLEEELSILEGDAFWINDLNFFRNAATVSSLARETFNYNARAIEMSCRKTVGCMTFANNNKEQLSRPPDVRFVAWNTGYSDVIILRLI